MLETCIHSIGHGIRGLLKHANLVDVVWQVVAKSDPTIDNQRVGTLAGQGIICCSWLLMQVVLRCMLAERGV